MKFAVIPLFALLSAIPTALGVPEPAAVRGAEMPGPSFLPTVLETRELVKRDNTAIIKVDNLAYRSCPRVADDCPIKGRYAKNTRITLTCYTRDNTTPVKCDLGWGKIAGHDYWVPLVWGQYVAWDGGLPYCQ